MKLILAAPEKSKFKGSRLVQLAISLINKILTFEICNFALTIIHRSYSLFQIKLYFHINKYFVNFEIAWKDFNPEGC